MKLVITEINQLSTTVAFDNVQVMALRAVLEYVADVAQGEAEEFAAAELRSRGYHNDSNDVLAMIGQIEASLSRVTYPYGPDSKEAKGKVEQSFENMEPVGRTQ